MIKVQSNEGTRYVPDDVYYKHEHKYFVGEDGIRYGHDDFSKMIIPKEIFIEAFEKYIGI